MSSEKMPVLKRAWDLLGSRGLSVFLFITAITYSLIAYVFSLLVPQAWFELFQTLLPMLILYITFFINLLICEIKWLPVVIRRCRMPDLPGLADLKRFSTVVQSENAGGIDAVKNTLSRKLYKIREYEEGGKSVLYACRGLTSPIGNILFHFSFFFLLAGILVALLYRVDGKVFVVEGNRFDGRSESYEKLDLSSRASLPDVSFTLDSVVPEYWGDRLLFTGLRADMTLRDGSKESAWLSKQVDIAGAGVSINGLGYAFSYLLKDKNGKELAAGLSRLNLFMPGMEDTLTIPGYPHKFMLAYYPDARVDKGDVKNVSMNRKNPMIGLRVYRGRLPVFTGLLREREEVSFDGLKVSFPEVKYWGDFSIVKNPGFKFIWIAFAMMVIGLVWRFIFFRREVVIVQADDGIKIFLRSEMFPKLFEGRIREIADIS